MRTILLAGVITLAVVVVVALVGRSVAPDSFRWPGPEATVTVTATPSGASGAGGGQASSSLETPAATPSPASGAPVQWTRVATVSGAAHKKSAVFRLRGDAQKLSWKLGGKGMPFAHIYVTDADSSVYSTVPDAAPNVRGPGSTLLHLEKGRYYLDVYSESTWSVTIWDAR